MQRRATIAALALVLAACGSSDDGDRGAATVPGVTDAPATTAPPTTPGDTTPTDTIADWPATPPPVVFEPDGGPVAREPFTVCWSEPEPDDPNEEYESYCADGVPEENPPVVEPVDGRVWFEFPVAGWEFSASYLDSGEVVTVERLTETTWELVVPDDAPGGPITVSGFGPQGDVHVAVSLPGPVPPSDVSANECVEAIDALRSGLPVYDYEPATDMVALIDGVDAVVLGAIDGLLGGDDEIEFVLADARTWGGSEEIGAFVIDGRLVDTSLADELAGVPVIAFVHQLDDGRFGADVQGVFAQCPSGPVNVIEPLPDDPRVEGLELIETLAGITAERKAPVGPDADVYGVVSNSPDAIEIGDTAPVQVWWRCASGVSVRVGDDLYLPVGEIDGLVPRPAREWVRDDFPADWEVVIYNETPVDGDDWVILDAVAERIDADTLRVDHVDGDTIGTFTRDTTPPEERALCG